MSRFIVPMTIAPRYKKATTSELHGAGLECYLILFFTIILLFYYLILFYYYFSFSFNIFFNQN